MNYLCAIGHMDRLPLINTNLKPLIGEMPEKIKQNKIIGHNSSVSNCGISPGG